MLNIDEARDSSLPVSPEAQKMTCGVRVSFRKPETVMDSVMEILLLVF